METSWHLSIGDVLDQLLADRLIDSCHMTSDRVTIVQGTKQHTFPIQQAHPFLVGMLRGRSWNTGLRADVELPHSHLRAVGRRGPGSASRSGANPPRIGGERSPLDDLLDLAMQMEIIEGFELDADRNVLTIALSACETEMPQEDAIVFLGECILHSLTTMQRDPSREDSIDRGDRSAALV